MSYFYPSYSFGQSSVSPPVKKRNDSLGLSAKNIISLNKPTYTPNKLTSEKLLDMGPLDKIKSIESKLKNIDNQMDARTELFKSFVSRNSNPNVGIYNPYIGNPIIGQNPNKKFETNKSVARVSNTINNQPKSRLESIEYQNLLQEQLIQQRKEKLQENNFHINNLIFQEIDEMSDNLELFKIEMFNHVRKLERNQEKLNLGEVLDELTHMREFFKGSLDRQEKKKDRELTMLKDDIGLLKDEMMDNFRYETKQNRDIFKNMNNELRGYQEAMNNKFDDMDSRQKVQMNGIRNMMKKMYDDKEDDGYNRKDRDRRLSYERNKMKKSEEEEVVNDNFPKRRGGVIEMPDDRNRRGAVIREDDEEEIELDDEDSQSRDKYDTTNIKEKFNMQRDKDKKKELENLKPINTNNNFFKMKPINKLRKFVHSVVFVNKMKKSALDSLNEFNSLSLKEFINTYEYAYSSLKKWVYESIKKNLDEIISNENLKIDIISSKPSTLDAKEKCTNLIEVLKRLMTSLIRYTNEQTFDKKTIVFLKLIYTNNHFIPFKFYTRFELTRIRIIDGCIFNLKEQQKSMIYSVLIILKILVKFLLVDLNFDSGRVNIAIKKNLKVIASILYHETISLYSEHCKIEQDILNMEGLILSQKLRGKKNERIPITPGIEKSYARALKTHNDKVKQKEDIGDEISAGLSKINTRLPNYIPDNNMNQIEFILQSLYTKDEIKVYYYQSEFKLKELLYDWVKQLILVIHKVK